MITIQYINADTALLIGGGLSRWVLVAGYWIKQLVVKVVGVDSVSLYAVSQWPLVAVASYWIKLLVVKVVCAVTSFCSLSGFLMNGLKLNANCFPATDLPLTARKGVPLQEATSEEELGNGNHETAYAAGEGDEVWCEVRWCGWVQCASEVWGVARSCRMWESLCMYIYVYAMDACFQNFFFITCYCIV